MLAEAQQLGYAEADPSFDIDGVDAAHKLAILAGARLRLPRSTSTRSTSRASATSRRSTSRSPSELGYRIKLLGIARRTEHGLEQRVHPCMVPHRHADRPGRGRVQRRGGRGRLGRRHGLCRAAAPAAGRPRRRWSPTSSTSRAGVDLPVLRRAERARSQAMPPAPMDRHCGAYYIRLMVVDRPGVIADVAACLRDHEVSIESMIQRGAQPGRAGAGRADHPRDRRRRR